MNRRHRHHAGNRRGIFIADALTGLFLVTALAVALTAALSHQRRAITRTANERAALRSAEIAMTALQLGEPLPKFDEQTLVIVKAINDADHAALPPGWQWVSVRATVRGRWSQLIGVVPALKEQPR